MVKKTVFTIEKCTNHNEYLNCTKCPRGQTSYNNFDCTECIPGTYSPVEGSLCLQCPENTYSDIFGAKECTPCPEGMTTGGSVGQTSCKCSSGCSDCTIEYDVETNKTIHL